MFKLGRVKLKVVELKIDEIEENNENNNSKHFATKVNDKSLNDIYRASNINVEHLNQNIYNLNNFNKNSNVKTEIQANNEKKQKNTCRICYCDDVEIDSPLIIPCNCSGTMRYIHFSCLQTWLKSKIVVKSTINDYCASYSLKQIECELCKAIFPGNI